MIRCPRTIILATIILLPGPLVRYVYLAVSRPRNHVCINTTVFVSDTICDSAC